MLNVYLFAYVGVYTVYDYYQYTGIKLPPKDFRI